MYDFFGPAFSARLINNSFLKSNWFVDLLVLRSALNERIREVVFQKSMGEF